MNPSIASQAHLLAVQSSLVNRALEHLTEEQIWTRPSDRLNSVGWLLGHLTWARNGMLSALGGEPEPLPWAATFARGAEHADRASYPATADILAGLKQINEKLKAQMAVVTDAHLDSPSAVRTPSPDKTVRGTVAFLVFHDAYHVGQVAMLVKWLGHPSLVG